MIFGLAPNDTSSAGVYWMIDINDGIGLTSNEIGHTYIVDFDFRIASSGKQITAAEILRMTFTKDKANITNGSGIFLHNQTHLYYGSEYYYIGHTAGILVSTETWYDIRYEYTITSESASQLSVYLNGEMAYTVALNTVVAPEAFYMQMQRSAAKQEYAIDNLWYYDYNENEKLESGNGKYYTEYLNSKTDSTVLEFNDKSNITSGASYVTVADGILNSATTGTHHLYKITSNNVTTADDETFIIEMDFKANSSSATSAVRTNYIKVYSGSAYLGAISIFENGKSFMVGGSSKPALELNEWYNIRIEITDDVGVYYVNDIYVGDFGFQDGKSTAGYTGEIVVQIENLEGSNGFSYSIDNLVFDNIDTAPKLTYYEQYKAGMLDGAVVYDFDDIKTIAKGEGEILEGTTQNTLNVGPGNKTAYVNITDGALNFGYDGTTVTGNDNTNYAVRLNAGLSAAVGQTYIIEYDFTFGGSKWNTSAATHLLLVVNAYTKPGSSGAMSVMAGMQGNRVNSDGNGVGEALTLGDPTYIYQKFVKDQTYKIRIEITVTGEKTATVDYYIDDVAVFSDQQKNISSVTDGRNFLSLYALSFQIYARATADYTIDNVVFAVIGEAAE